MRQITSVCTCVLIAGGACSGQSLYEQTPSAGFPSGHEREGAGPAMDGAPSLEMVSLSFVGVPEPREFLKNDLVTIIISERTQTQRESTLETEKETSYAGEITDTIDLMKLLELRLEAGRGPDDESLPAFGLEWDQDFEGEGEYERDDQVTARVTARVVEVYPNGTMLLESRTRVDTDGEEQVIRLSGVCRGEDVTEFNTVQSNQMFDLDLTIENAGELRKASRKGLIPKALDTLFNF